MKARLNLTIEDSLLTSINNYAAKQQLSVSELVEGYFKSVTRPTKQNNILQLVDKLDGPTLIEKVDFKNLYHKENAKKHGF